MKLHELKANSKGLCLLLVVLILAQSPLAYACSSGILSQRCPGCNNNSTGAPAATGGGGNVRGNRGAQNGSQLGVGDPINVTNYGSDASSVYQDVVDLSIPVKHGLSLSVRRTYVDVGGNNFNFCENGTGRVSLGYFRPNSSSGWSNWFLSPYECWIERAFSSNIDAYLADAFFFVDESGNSILFDWDENQFSAEGDKLNAPYDASWGGFWHGVFRPAGDERNPVDVNKDSQTYRDLELHVIYDYDEGDEPDDAAMRADPDHIVAFVVREASGRQYHLEPVVFTSPEAVPGTHTQIGGHVRFIDANWRNNTPYEEPSAYTTHVDDYLEVTWIDSVCANNPAFMPLAIDKVKAPPSDGRELVFNHDAYDESYPYTHVRSVDLKTSDTLYSNLICYDYITDGYPIYPGRISRVWRGNNAKVGIQYDYSKITFDSYGVPDLSFLNKGNGINTNDLVLISEVVKAEGEDTTYTLPLVANERYSTGSPNYEPRMRQWITDPDTGDWRRAFRIEKVNVSPSGRKNVIWEDGQIGTDTGSRYHDPATSETYSTFIPRGTGWGGPMELDRIEFGDTDNPPPIIRHTFYLHGPSGENAPRWTRLRDKLQLSVPNESGGGSSWVTLERDEWVSPTLSGGTTYYPTGVARPTKITRYSNYESNGSGGWVEDADSAQVTEFAYNDDNNATKPSSVTHPNGVRILSDYNARGDLAQQLHQRWNADVLDYDTISTTTYAYIATDVNAGLLESVTVESAAGPDHVTEFTYTEEDGDGINAGKLAAVIVDGRESEYLFNDFSQPTSITTPEGTALNAYSDALEPEDPDYFLPPRLLVSTDVAGNETVQTYDDHGRVATITRGANDEGIAETTTYEYDGHGNLKRMTASDGGVTEHAYNIYGKRISTLDAAGTLTRYQYDAFGRMESEDVGTTDTVQDRLYRIEYTYSGPGTGCSSCGGAGGRANQVASRKIINGSDPGEFETLYFKYDLQGRKIGQGTTEDADDITYAYGADPDEVSTFMRLQSISYANSAGLWGSNELAYSYDALGRMSKEVYPSGRTIEFTYDAAGRTTSVKDPFGYVNQIAYDDEGRGQLAALTHSSLGAATFEYDGADRLHVLTLGNGADTAYGYDDFGRLDRFSVHDPGNVRIVRHIWEYDALNRKSVIDTDQYNVTGQIALEYDSASRVTREHLIDGAWDSNWDISYTYDQAENRTSIDDGTLDKTITYGAGNRETAVSGGGDPLEYDFKGNVVVRPPLGGGDSFAYAWNEYDRMIEADHGDIMAFYGYDSTGRQLGKAAFDLGDESMDVRLTYWLGLNKLAEERGASILDREVLKPDTEASDDPEVNHWASLDDVNPDTMEYVTDIAERGLGSRVLHLFSSEETGNNALFMLGDFETTPTNPHDSHWQTANTTLGVWLKEGEAQGNRPLLVVSGQVDHGGPSDESLLAFIQGSGSDFHAGNVYFFYVGDITDDGDWHYVEEDLAARIAEFEPGATLEYVNSVSFFADDLYVDDLILGSGRMERVYQTVPGTINTLGAQIGRGGLEVDGEPVPDTEWERWWYHANDAATMIALTTVGGTESFAPDGFGNYRNTGDGKLDGMGLDGKYFDEDAGLYYFTARWQDPERGRWMSREPYGIDQPNLYHFGYGQVYDGYDPNGLWWESSRRRGSASTTAGLAGAGGAVTVAGGLALADGPLPILDILGLLILSGAAIYVAYNPPITTTISFSESFDDSGCDDATDEAACAAVQAFVYLGCLGSHGYAPGDNIPIEVLNECADIASFEYLACLAGRSH